MKGSPCGKTIFQAKILQFKDSFYFCAVVRRNCANDIAYDPQYLTAFGRLFFYTTLYSIICLRFLKTTRIFFTTIPFG